MGGRTEPLAGDIGCRGATCRPGLGGNRQGAGKGCWDEKELAVCCALGCTTSWHCHQGCKRPCKGQRAHTLGSVGHTCPVAHSSFFLWLLCFVYNPMKTKSHSLPL